MRKYLLSIIIPVYNVERYLRECINSIICDSCDLWEIILIDDGSSDACPLICDEYARKDGRFRVIHKENGGVSSARNAGLDVAQGKWIWFVDSDDVVDMRPVGSVLEWLENHESIDLVMFDLKTFKDGMPVDESSAGAAEPVVIDDSLEKKDFLLKHVCYHHPRLWYSRGWIEHNPRQLRFTSGIRLAEDLEFQYKYLTLCGNPIRVNYVLYHYRLRDNSATGDIDYRIKAVEDLPKVLDGLSEWFVWNEVKVEAWLDYRIVKFVQNLLYSASLVPELDICNFQQTIRRIITEFRNLGFVGFNSLKMRIAYLNVRLYFLLNKVYLKIK